MFAAVCFGLLLFAAFCCSFPLFVAICLSLLLFAAGCSQKRPRKVPRWPSGDPKWLQNGPKIDQNWLLGLPGDPPGQLNPNFQSQGPILGHFWVPYGVPKSTKNQPLAQKVIPGTMFSSTFVAHFVFSNFSIGFCLIFVPKTTKNHNVFLKVVCFFLNQATFTKHCNLQVRSYVFTFRVFAFFLKKRPKNDTKIGYAEIIKKWGHGDPKIDPK